MSISHRGVFVLCTDFYYSQVCMITRLKLLLSSKIDYAHMDNVIISDLWHFTYSSRAFVVDCICYFKFQKHTHTIMTSLEEMTKRFFLSVPHVGSPSPTYPLSKTLCVWVYFCHFVDVIMWCVCVYVFYFYFLFSTKGFFLPLSPGLSPAPGLPSYLKKGNHL